MVNDDLGPLLWALLILAIGGGIMYVWNADLPAPLLWAGYVGMVVGAVMLVRWWIGLIR